MFPLWCYKASHILSWVVYDIHTSDHSFVMLRFDTIFSFYTNGYEKKFYYHTFLLTFFCGFTRAWKDLSVKSISYMHPQTHHVDASSTLLFVCCRLVAAGSYLNIVCVARSILCIPHNHNQFASKQSIFSLQLRKIYM